MTLLIGGGNGSAYAHQGELQFSEVTVDPTSGTVPLRASFPNPSNVLLPGMFVRAKINQATAPDVLMVPQQGVIRHPNGRPSSGRAPDKKVARSRSSRNGRSATIGW